MRIWFLFACVILLGSSSLPQQSPSSGLTTGSGQTGNNDSPLKSTFEAKIKAEWEAIKNKDKKAYGELLADEYQGVEVDGQGERTKLQSINELAGENVSNYTLWGLKVTPLCADATFVIYEVTIQFPPRSQVRYSRVYIGALWVKRGGEWKELHYQETRVK
jgi:hypothetical protein